MKFSAKQSLGIWPATQITVRLECTINASDALELVLSTILM